VNLEAYLLSKKIDSAAFLKAEPELWKLWSTEFESMHPNSFTAQKLYLINPIRRKYPLKSEPIRIDEGTKLETPEKPLATNIPPESSPAPVNPKPLVPRPVFKPKPKIS
jgi:hypothetical protein